MPALEAALSQAGPKARWIVVVGVHRVAGDDNYCLYFDAALPRRMHLWPIMGLVARLKNPSEL